MTTKTEEQEASVFAMELLIPEEFIREDVVGLTINVVDDNGIELKKLARKYGVSERLMLLRLTQIGFFKAGNLE